MDKCPVCAKEMPRFKNGNSRLACSQKCRNTLNREAKYPTPVEDECPVCGKGMPRFKNGTPRSACSRACHNRNRPGRRIAMQNRGKASCPACGAETTNFSNGKKRKACSPECHTRLRNAKRHMAICVCAKCDRVFLSKRNGGTKYCSRGCCNKAWAAAQHSGDPIRRAKRLGVEVDESIDRETAIASLGLECMGCGITCDQEAGIHAPNYPNLDHIYPLSRGGGHVWPNLQILCQSCNFSKGTKLPDWMVKSYA